MKILITMKLSEARCLKLKAFVCLLITNRALLQLKEHFATKLLLNIEALR